MKILVTGATGFIGRKLISELGSAGFQIRVLTRNTVAAKKVLPSKVTFFEWNFTSELPSEFLREIDAVVHLAGEPIAAKRWSAKQKQKIRDSRILSTQLISDAIAKRKGRPITFLSTSAIGFYGNRGDEKLTESSVGGSGFLADVCRDWEASTKGIPYGVARVVHLRIGIVLGLSGGALSKMRPAFRMGVGGRLGSGSQWMSWIHVDDLVSLIRFIIEKPFVEGVVNGVAPNPVTNRDFTISLGKEFGCPTLMTAPTFALKAILGEMSEMLLDSQRVEPAKALGAGFRFAYPTLESALKEIFCFGPGTEEWESDEWFSRSVDEVFAFFLNAKNLARITPPQFSLEVTSMSSEVVARGTEIEYRMKSGVFPFRWRAKIDDFLQNKKFVDVQTSGPYRAWRHTHEFFSVDAGTWARDRVKFALPMGAAGSVCMGASVRRKLREIFSFRNTSLNKIFNKNAQ